MEAADLRDTVTYAGVLHCERAGSFLSKRNDGLIGARSSGGFNYEPHRGTDKGSWARSIRTSRLSRSSVVDQNSDDRIVPVLGRYQTQLKISRITTPERHGMSSGRNDGWRCSHP